MTDKEKKTTKKAPAKKPLVKKEAVYTANELAQAAEKLFGVMPECVTAAFRTEGKAEATKTEAKAIVKKYLSKEVK